jgi:hypothetical protein
MNLRGLVSVSGKPGLFKLIGQNKSGFIILTDSPEGKPAGTMDVRLNNGLTFEQLKEFNHFLAHFSRSFCVCLFIDNVLLFKGVCCVVVQLGGIDLAFVECVI